MDIYIDHIICEICLLDLLAWFGRCAALLVVLLVSLCPFPWLIIASKATTSIGRLDRLLPQISLQLWHSRPANKLNWWLLHEEGNQSWFPKKVQSKSDKKHNQHLQVVNVLMNNIFLTSQSVNDTGLGSKASKVTLTTPSSKRICSQSKWLSEGVQLFNPMISSLSTVLRYQNRPD